MPAIIGAKAPDFTLKNESGKDTGFYRVKGKKKAVLAFIREEDDRFTREILDYLKDDFKRIESLDSVLIVVSPAGKDINKKLVKDMGLPFHILSDRELSVIKKYGIYNEYDGIVGPAVFVISRANIIAYSYAGTNPDDILEDSDILAALRASELTGIERTVA